MIETLMEHLHDIPFVKHSLVFLVTLPLSIILGGTFLLEVSLGTKHTLNSGNTKIEGKNFGS